jgi:hypothetical protein
LQFAQQLEHNVNFNVCITSLENTATAIDNKMDHLLGFYEKQLQPPSKLQQTIISNADTTLCPDFRAQDATNTCLPPHHGKRSLVLDIPYNQQYPNSSILPQDLYLSLFTAIKHQNIV